MILEFAVVNSLVSSEFKPSIFVDITSDRSKKRRALGYHNSQIECGRILWNGLDCLEARFGLAIGVSSAEAFALRLQEGAPDPTPLLSCLNDSAFHRFWAWFAPGGRVDLFNNSLLCPSGAGQLHVHSANEQLLNIFLDKAEMGEGPRMRMASTIKELGTAPTQGTSILMLGRPLRHGLHADHATLEPDLFSPPNWGGKNHGAITLGSHPVGVFSRIGLCEGANSEGYRSAVQALCDERLLRKLLDSVLSLDPKGLEACRVYTARTGQESQIVKIETLALGPHLDSRKSEVAYEM